MEKTITYGELKEGQLVWFHGYECTVSNIWVAGICDNQWHFGERILRFTVSATKSKINDGFRGTYYDGKIYGGVESCTILALD